MFFTTSGSTCSSRYSSSRLRADDLTKFVRGIVWLATIAASRSSERRPVALGNLADVALDVQPAVKDIGEEHPVAGATWEGDEAARCVEPEGLEAGFFQEGFEAEGVAGL